MASTSQGSGSRSDTASDRRSAVTQSASKIASSTIAAVKSSTTAPAAVPPLVPLSLIDAPTQRVYIASAFLSVQAYKVYCLIFSLLDVHDHAELGRCLLIDLAFVVTASRLHTPRFDFTRRKWATIFFLIAFVDWTAAGGWRVLLHAFASLPILGWLGDTLANAWSETFDRQLSISENRVRLRDIIRPKSHILGQHTIHLLPHSSASFLPIASTRQSSHRRGAAGASHSREASGHSAGSHPAMPLRASPSSYKLPFEESVLDWYSAGEEAGNYRDTRRPTPSSAPDQGPSLGRSSETPSYCVDVSNPRFELQLPIAFSNAEPHWLSYSITPLDPSQADDVRIINVTIPRNALIRTSKEKNDIVHREDRLDLELEDAEEDEDDSRASTMIRQHERNSGVDSKRAASIRRKKPSSNEMIYNLPIRPDSIGRIRLERVMDRHQYDVRLSRGEVMFVECPRMGFAVGAGNKSTTSQTQHLCPGEDAELDVWVNGITPLELSYKKVFRSGSQSNQAGERHTISRITGAQHAPALSGEEDSKAGLHQRKSHLASDWAVPRNVTLPLTIDTSKEGPRSYILEEVQDALGNVFAMSDEAAGATLARDIYVHGRPIVSFEGCSSVDPVRLLRGGPPRGVGISISGDLESGSPFHARVHFEGESGQTWDRDISFSGRRTSLQVDQPGTYTLEGVESAHCAGEVGSHWLCAAQVLPTPTANISFDPIKDQCAGSVGVKALAELSGTPPFKVRYEVKRQGKPVEKYERTIERTREEIEFRPTTEGEVTYTFKGLSDANYRDVTLQGPTFTQVLHPVASASFEGAQGRQRPSMVVHSCEGDRASRQVHLTGVGPFALTYAIRSSSGELLKTQTVPKVQGPTYDLEFQVPSVISERGGGMTISLIKVKDAKGCERPLTVPDLFVDVQRTKPTAAFVDPRESTMLEGHPGTLPIRLSGQGPWTIKYRRKGDAGSVQEARLTLAEDSVQVDSEGTYEIVGVRDAHCPGIVSSDHNSHTIHVKARPQASFAASGASSRGDVLALQPVCAGTPDDADLHLVGHFPIQVTYRHHGPGAAAKESTFSSAQNVTTFRLRTETEGKHTYELVRLGDIVYGPADVKSSGRGALQKLEQQVLPLPKATYKTSDAKSQRVSLCQGESLNSEARRAILPVVSLEGKPPFALEFAIKDAFDVTRKQLIREGITATEHKLDVDSDEFQFDNPGKWSVELVRVVDGNGCERIVDATAGIDGRSPHRRTLDVEIVEAANISPIGTRDDYCVGESIDFVLQGTPPFTVTYDFQGRKSHATSKKTTFSRVAEKPGTLRIEAVAHQHNRCKTDIDSCAGLTKTIHDLPSVHIREGSHYIEDLREGNQAEIAFKLSGEPPFSFTYQRKQAIDRYSRPQVLETHTVTGVMSHTHTIKTTEEGTWSIVWLQDRWCSVSLSTGASKSTSNSGEARQQGCVAPAVGQ